MRPTVAVTLILSSPAFAGGECDLAAFQAAAESAVPLPVLTAITRAETEARRGRVQGPWPWTINHAGVGEWFETREEALSRIGTLVARGESLDIGCFQINTRWHAQAFASAEEMIDPLTNARYAARYLTDLYAETGEWKSAVAAYHSRDPDRGAGYAERVALIMRAPDTPVSPPGIPGPAPRENGFPLLLAGDPVSTGSLFGASGSVGPLVGP